MRSGGRAILPTLIAGSLIALGLIGWKLDLFYVVGPGEVERWPRSDPMHLCA